MPVKIVPSKWLFKPTEDDVRMVHDERQRLEHRNPGVKITRADAMRSLFLRATATATEPGDDTDERRGTQDRQGNA